MSTANHGTRHLVAFTILAGLALASAMTLAEQEVLEEIVVTAQKREQSLRDVAVSITAVGGERIRELDILNFEDLERVTSGLQLIRLDPRNVAISNRGVYFDPESGTEPSVDVYMNGVRQREDNVFGALYDIAQVEILRGPQSSLQGATSPAGAIIINTAKPNLDEVDGYLQTSIADIGYNVQGALSVPLVSGTAAMRLAFYDDENDQSEIINRKTGRLQDVETYSARLSIELALQDDLVASFSYQYLDQTLYGTPQIKGQRDSLAAPADPPVEVACAVWPPPPRLTQRCPQTITEGDNAAFANSDTFSTRRADIYTLDVQWDLGNGANITYVLGYTDSTKSARTEHDLSSNLPLQNHLATLGGVITDTDYQTHQTTTTVLDAWSHELRYASQGRSFWNYLFGLYVFDQETATDFRAYNTRARYIPFVDPITQQQQFPPIPLKGLSKQGIPDGTVVTLTGGHIEGLNFATRGSIPFDREILALFTSHEFQLSDATKLEAALRWQEIEGFQQSDILFDSYYQEDNISIQNAKGTVTVAGQPSTDEALVSAAVAAAAAGVLASTKARIAATRLIAIAERHQKPKNDAVTGTLSLSYDFNDEFTGFVSYNRNYRDGGVSVNPGAALADEYLLYDSEEVDALEVGIKSLLGGRAEVNAVFYYQAFDGYLGFVRGVTYMPAIDPATGQAPAAPLLLAGGLVFNGDMTSMGIDVDWRALAGDKLTFGGSLNYNQSEYDDAEVPCNVREPGEVLGYCTYNGRVAGSPELQFSVFAEFVHSLSFGDFFIRSNTKYSGGILSTRAVDFGTDPGETESYVLSDLFIGLRALDGKWEVSGFVKNLADDRADLNLYNPGDPEYDPAGYFTEVNRLPPRTYGIRAKYDF